MNGRKAVSAGVVPTKLRAPLAAPGTLARGRLLERLCASHRRAVLVSAPAGFGKTVLVTDWLRAATPPYAWTSLDTLDNDPRRLLNHVAAAIEGLGTPAAADAAALLRLTGPAAEPGFAPELLPALDALDPRTVLVLDDVHVLAAGPALQVLQRMLDARAAAPRLVLITRVDPPLALGRLRAAGELLELREQDLRFTAPEAVLLFQRLLPGGLDEELATRLERRTEGWAAGLRMAAIALEHAVDRRRAVDEFTGSHRFVVDYLVEEAITRQSPAVQQFLMETSVLARFTADACVAVTGDPAARALLHQVEEANLFVVPLGADRTWYRYHHLFAELLRFRLRRLQPERVDELYERASAWFEEQGDTTEALEHALLASTKQRVAPLLDRHALFFLARSELGMLARWFAHVSRPLEQPYPTMLLALGWLRVLTEREPALDSLLDAAAAACGAHPPGYDDRALADLRIELDILRAFAARFAGRFDEAIAIGRAVLAEVPADAAYPRGRVLYNQARVHMTLGEMEPALELLRHSLDDNLSAGTHYLVLAGHAQLGAVLLQREGVAAALHHLEAALAFAEARGLAKLPAFGTLLLQLGIVRLAADDVEEAVPLLERAIAIGTAGNLPEPRARGLLELAQARAARGRFAEAERALAEADALARVENVGIMDTDVGLERLRVALLRHGAGAAPLPHAIDPAPADDARWSTLGETRHVLAMIRALRDDSADARADALRLAERLGLESEPRRRHVALCLARTVQALLHEGSGKWQLLDAALASAAARGYVRPLLELGEPLHRMLLAAGAQPLAAAARLHAGVLLAGLARAADGGRDTEPHNAAARWSPAVAGPVQRLTGRELAVLELLCNGLSNKAIARSMHVSTETVKTHLKHIYDKLDVSRRHDAVARARSLGVTPAARV